MDSIDIEGHRDGTDGSHETVVVDRVQTQVHRDLASVDVRLSELDVERSKLLKVAAVARNEAANVTPFHCANAAGTLAYQHGTWALRHEFVGDGWKPAQLNGVEVIRHDELKIRIAFANVDVACDDNHTPKPRSPKGGGSERACMGNLFGYLPHYAPRPSGEATYYLMLDENGAVELSRPIIKGGTFSAVVERIYLSDGGDLGVDQFFDDKDIAEVPDPQIVRK